MGPGLPPGPSAHPASVQRETPELPENRLRVLAWAGGLQGACHGHPRAAPGASGRGDPLPHPWVCDITTAGVCPGYPAVRDPHLGLRSLGVSAHPCVHDLTTAGVCPGYPAVRDPCLGLRSLGVSAHPCVHDLTTAGICPGYRAVKDPHESLSPPIWAP